VSDRVGSVEEDVSVMLSQEKDEEGLGAGREIPLGQRVPDSKGEPEAGRSGLPGVAVDPAVAQL